MDEVGSQWSLRRRVIALCLLVAVVLGFLAAGATTTAMANRGQLDDLLDTIGPMHTASNSLLGSLVDQQTAMRGFVLRGGPEDLETYRQAVLAEQTHTEHIHASPAATDRIRAELAVITARAQAWRTDFADPAIAATQAGDAEAAHAILSDAARIRFDDLRSAVTTMQNSMQEVRDEAVTSIRDTSTTLMFVLIVAVAIVLIGVAALLITLQRMVIGPVTHLAAQVRAVARGRYDLQITGSGPPELARLSDDVDTMRRQIANDLAEVRSARWQIEQANVLLEQQAAELTRSNRDLEQFAYVASHDLQEPLRKVASFCQLLQRRYQGQLDERADQYIAFAVNGAQRMQRLINDLLAFSRIGRSEAGFTDVDLGQLVAEAAQTEHPEAEVTWSDLPVVRGESVLLATLLTNLIGNSIKFRQPDVPPRVHISARRDGDQWEISCADNGIGIKPEYVEKVFVIFQRLHPREAYPGTGIGLAMVKKIVEYHGGAIWIDTTVSEGTTVRFTLPVPADPIGPALPVAAQPVEVGPAYAGVERPKETVA